MYINCGCIFYYIAYLHSLRCKYIFVDKIRSSVSAILYMLHAGPSSSYRNFNDYRWLLHLTLWRHGVKSHHCCKDPKSHFPQVDVRVGNETETCKSTQINDVSDCKIFSGQTQLFIVRCLFSHRVGIRSYNALTFSVSFALLRGTDSR